MRTCLLLNRRCVGTRLLSCNEECDPPDMNGCKSDCTLDSTLFDQNARNTDDALGGVVSTRQVDSVFALSGAMFIVQRTRI